MSMTVRVRRLGLAALAAGTMALAIAPPARASSVAPMNVQTMSDYAAQVIIGRVDSVRSYWAENPRRIESEVVFEQVQYLKGISANSSTQFTLIVPGGTVAPMQMRVCCAPNFAPGEKWLLFLLPTYKTFPIVGLFQGAMRIDAGGGVERVFDSARNPVVGFDSEGFVEAAAPQASQRDLHQHVISAAHIRVIPPASRGDDAVALPLADFLDHVTPILAASQQYDQSQPAGRRELVVYHPTSLKLAPGAGHIGGGAGFPRASVPEVAGAARRAATATPAPQPAGSSNDRDKEHNTIVQP